MILDSKRTVDPRDNLEKARQIELIRFAQSCGLRHITETMPAILIRAELRARNLTNIKIPHRPIGATNHPQAMATAPADAKIVEVNAAADLARQYAQQQARQPEPQPVVPQKPQRLKERPRSAINQMRDYCKANGIKMERRDGMASLKAKIEAHKAQNGKDLPQRSQ